MPTTTTTLKNTHRAIYLEVSDGKYARLGEGVNSFTPSNSPTVDTKHYINASAPTHSITAIEKQYSFSADYVKGDDAIDFIAGLDGATGDDCKSTLVDVDMSDGSASAGYKAKKYNIVISLEQPYSIEGGQNQQMSGTFYTNGDVVIGTFKPSADGGTFTAGSAS